MRRFYEAWNMLDSNSAVATAELCFENSAVEPLNYKIVKIR